jgi:glutamate/tyrosine decarboxylase-like PLP-dependent enzyme
VWATLRAYGRDGHRAIVEHDLDLAQELAAHVDATPDLDRLAEVQLNIVCFRYRPPGSEDGPELDELNRRIGEEALVDGRVFFGSTNYGGRAAFRPALVNWRTRSEDVRLVPDVVSELGARLAARV